jgi:hypothetical protein
MSSASFFRPLHRAARSPPPKYQILSSVSRFPYYRGGVDNDF